MAKPKGVNIGVNYCRINQASSALCLARAFALVVLWSNYPATARFKK
jgi:hypothetical protein